MTPAQRAVETFKLIHVAAPVALKLLEQAFSACEHDVIERIADRVEFTPPCSPEAMARRVRAMRPTAPKVVSE